MQPNHSTIREDGSAIAASPKDCPPLVARTSRPRFFDRLSERLFPFRTSKTPGRPFVEDHSKPESSPFETLLPIQEKSLGRDVQATGNPADLRGASPAAWAGLAAGFLVILWFLIWIVFFWRTNTPLWFQGPDAPLGVFSHLSLPETFSWMNCPPLELAIAVVALLVYWAVGWLFLRGCDVFFTRLEEAALSLLFGAGLCGLVFEALGMAHWLTRWPVLAGTALLAAGLAWRAGRRRRAPFDCWSPAAARRLAESLVTPAAAGESTGANTDFPVADKESAPPPEVGDPLERRAAWEDAERGTISLLASALGFIAARPDAASSERASAAGASSRQQQPPPDRNHARKTWRRAYARMTALPGDSLLARVVLFPAMLLIALISLLIFVHALFYPETYWDSLILYLGYGRMTFLEHGFPFKATAQVGYGLGANYPHLFSTHAAAVAAVVGQWSDVPARLWAPVAALAATALIYAGALRLWKNQLAAVLCALLFRALPYQIAYSTYASDYALAMLFGAAFLLLAFCYIASPLPGLLLPLTLLPALAMHLNFLMGVLWPVWALALALAHWRRPLSPLHRLAREPQRIEEFETALAEDPLPREPAYAMAWGAGSVFSLARNRRIWAALAIAVVLASPWHVRNWWLTGNPVYAFFPGIFGGIRINEEVLRSAEGEWYANGDGIGRVASLAPDWENLPDADSDAATTDSKTSGVAARSFANRLAASWMFWAGFETFHYPGVGARLERGRWRDRFAYLVTDFSIPARGRSIPADDSGRPSAPGTAVLLCPHAYKLAPTALGLALPGAAAWIILGLAGFAAISRPRKSAPVQNSNTGADSDLSLISWMAYSYPARAGMVLAAFASMFLAYEYLIADLYLYQILPIVLPIALFPGWILASFWRRAEIGAGRSAAQWIFGILCALILVVGIVPGLAMSLMGFKYTGAKMFAGEIIAQSNLGILRHPGMPPDMFLALQYGDDASAWDYINAHLRGERLLTHENRHYVLDPSITLVHLDDWSIQKMYPLKSDRERMQILRNLNIKYYYYIPNESRHAVNQRAGVQSWRGTPRLREIRRWGDNILYKINWSAEGLPDTPPARPAPLEDYIPRTRIEQ